MDGKLNTPQLRLAYSALVRSASVSAFTSSNGAPDDMYTLAWYCVQLIVDTIHELLPVVPSISNSKGKQKENEQEKETTPNIENSTDRVHRLHLMLISTISSLPLPLMLRALNETRVLISAYPVNDIDNADEQSKKDELVDALFHELLEKTGDREKEAAIRWWYKYRPTLMPGKEARNLGRSFPGSRDQKEAGAKSGLKGYHNSEEGTQLDQPMLSRL